MKPITRSVLVLCFFAVLQAQTPAQKPNSDTELSQAKAGVPSGMDLLWGVKIPMRDGVRLNATTYRPHGAENPLPVIFELSPYPMAWESIPFYFARHGYVFAAVDTRGRGNSEGTFNPFIQEPQDGYDIVEWMAKQPWSNGKVAMWGGSYVGFDQWMTLREKPPHLATIIPAASPYVGVDFPTYHNIFESYIIQWMTFTSGLTGNKGLYVESAFWIEKFTEMYRLHLPFRSLDTVVGNTTTVFQEWLRHPVMDSHWKRLEISADQYKQISVPILTITGSYDDDQAGALTYYKEHMRYGMDEAKNQHYLIIGPWDHDGSILENKKEVAGLTFGDASLLDLKNLHAEWYDWTLKNGEKPEFLKKRVAYYVMGADQWKYADSLESISNFTRTLYLDSEHGRANDVTNSGRLADSPRNASEPDHFTYDPLDTRPGEELDREPVNNYLTDQRYAVNLFGEGVVYHSEPFAKDTEISGTVKLTAWMAMDVADTDFRVTLYEILRDGSSVQLTSDLMRARYRDSRSEEKLVKPGEIIPYLFQGFTFFSRQIAKGSRLRLVLSCPNSINLEKNYNSGGVVAEETAKDARTAHITVYHDAAHPSRLELPFVQ